MAIFSQQCKAILDGPDGWVFYRNRQPTTKRGDRRPAKNNTLSHLELMESGYMQIICLSS